MIISSRTECGLRALIEIARSDGGPVKRAVIADNQKIPLPFLTQILRTLVNGEIVTSLRGPSGGYVLAKPAAETSLLEVVNLLQGPVTPRACVDSFKGEACDLAGGCGLQGVWTRLRDAGDNVLRNITIKDISAGPESERFLGLAGG